MEEHSESVLLNELDTMAFVYFRREMREEAAQALRLAQRIRRRMEQKYQRQAGPKNPDRKGL